LNDRLKKTLHGLQYRIAQSWLNAFNQDHAPGPVNHWVREILVKKPARLGSAYLLIALAGFSILVPTARLELAQLAPLPPQDSVSTNFTTSAGDQYFTLH
jgi:hypothetical protein